MPRTPCSSYFIHWNPSIIMELLHGEIHKKSCCMRKLAFHRQQASKPDVRGDLSWSHTLRGLVFADSLQFTASNFLLLDDRWDMGRFGLMVLGLGLGHGIIQGKLKGKNF